MLLSRYRPGMAYGTHVDDAVIGGHRTDLSFTLPLSPPDAYGGGGLAIDDGIEERLFRPAAGDAILYPTGAPHRVVPVDSGERLAIVGWVTSRVRDPVAREILHDLDVAARDLEARAAGSPGLARLIKARTNLYRHWAES
jgi:PKHD-type hydroxylase